MEFCPNCGSQMIKNEKFKKYSCFSCGYQIKFDELSSLEEINDFNSFESVIPQLCPECHGKYVHRGGVISCLYCGKTLEKANKDIKNRIEHRKYYSISTDTYNYKTEGYYKYICPHCNKDLIEYKEKWYCEFCNHSKLKEERLKYRDKFYTNCPSCGGEFEFNEATLKISCKSCGFQPEISNKEKVIDEDFSSIEAVQCRECGSNEGFSLINNEYVCKSCGNHLDKNTFKINYLNNYLEKDGLIARSLEEKSISCKNCGSPVTGFKYFKTEICEHCNTINVIIEDINSLRVEPNRISEFKSNLEDIENIFNNFFQSKNISPSIISPFKKIYIPFWNFHFEKGIIKYVPENKKLENFVRTEESSLERDYFILPLSDIWICAKKEYGEDFFYSKSMNYEDTVEYDSSCLNIQTDRYNLGSAQTFTKADLLNADYIKKNIAKLENLDIGEFIDFKVYYGTTKYKIEHILLPFWQIVVELKGRHYLLNINDKNKAIHIHEKF